MFFVWNDHTQTVVIPDFISYLNESMSVKMNKFACPGFLFWPCKPHTQGIENPTTHSVEIGIVYVWDIFIERDHMIPMVIPDFDKSHNMKTVLLRI